jgi:copper(I)-binding protein
MRLPILLLAALAALAGCNSGTESSRSVINPWIRLPAVAGQPAAGYAVVAATADHRALTAISSPRAGRIEMHETMTHGTMAGMKKLERIDLTGESEIVFAPGGRHMMLFDLDPALKAGDTADLVFHFGNGETSTLPAQIIGAGDENPFEK